ncbi:hypothetical protein E4T49_01911 [Aureobasidium sp. EXF-10728]|nr:hypothetical protein E4T49_01911 [Aureobasidium sp. EXF-10728]
MTTTANASSALVQVFGTDGKVPNIGELVENFDFSKLSVKDHKRSDYLHCDLAPSFGKLTKAGLQRLDDELKIMIAGTTKLIGEIPPEQRSWDKVIECCMQNPLMEPKDDKPISREDEMLEKSSSVFKVSGAPDDSIVKKVSHAIGIRYSHTDDNIKVATWFHKFIDDQDILDSTKIDINTLGRIVAQTGATISDFESFWGKHEVHEQTMVDIGILRYPDIDNPFFKVYRIQLVAKSDCTRILFAQDDMNGIRGRFDCRKFKPRESVTKSMTSEARGKAVSYANSLFP